MLPSFAMSALAFRPANEEDLDRLVEIHGAAFPDARGAAARRRNFEQSALGRLSDLVVAHSGDRILGHGFAFPLHAFFGGKAVPIVGIASVGVAPEARGRGVASALIQHIHEAARQAGSALSMLFAWRHGFYARLGYAEVACSHRFGCDPRAVPRAWVEAARGKELRAATGADREALLACYRREAVQRTGWLHRPETLWSRLLLAERLRTVVVAKGEAGVAGYVVFEIAQDEPHAETRMFVRELVADDDDTRRTLWGFLGAQAGQVAEIEIELEARDPTPFALTDVDGRRGGTERIEHDLGSVVAGPMVHLLDARRALGARGYAREGEANLSVEGDAFRLEVRGGEGKVVHLEPSSDRVELDARTLGSVAFGGLGALDAARLGLVRGPTEAVARVDELLRVPPFFTLDRF
jgi:predicted acetyltransferase